MIKPNYNLLINSGLAYVVKYVKGVFHMLNSFQSAGAAPILILSGLSMCLILSSLNVFLDSSKNSFLLV
jgi:hypothetical protein